MKKTNMLIFISAVVAACSAKGFAPAEQSIVAMQQKVPDITLVRAKQGYQLYSQKCASCHRLYQPGKYSVSQWNRTLPKMFPKAKITDTEQQVLIGDYLHAMSK
jgi:cytochrome c5